MGLVFIRVELGNLSHVGMVLHKFKKRAGASYMAMSFYRSGFSCLNRIRKIDKSTFFVRLTSTSRHKHDCYDYFEEKGKGVNMTAMIILKRKGKE